VTIKDEPIRRTAARLLITQAALFLSSALEAVYWAKERLSRFYRMKSVTQAARELTRRTLKTWRIPILNFWTSRQTNARVEGFNNRSARSPARWTESVKVDEPAAGGCPQGTRVHYRLRLLNACGT